MPSKNMLPKGKRRHTVKKEYRVARTAANELAEQEQAARDAALYSTPVELEDDDEEINLADGAEVSDVPVAAAPVIIPEELIADAEDANKRLDAVLARRIVGISRARVQLWIERGSVTVDGEVVRASHKLRGGETIRIQGDLAPAPLKAVAEDIPLDVVYEDLDLAVINKPSAMMVHAGNGATEEARHRGTLVNALLHHFAQLSSVGGDLRPGIVHRLDKETSGLILVAKNDVTHRKLSEMFSERRINKTYIALLHGALKQQSGTINSAIARDTIRRTRMRAIQRADEKGTARSAITHYKVMQRIDTPWGRFTLVEVKIETGRTHQIRVHLSSIGHPVVGDALYGAPHSLPSAKNSTVAAPQLQRNFLHAARLEFAHPTSQKPMQLEAPLPPELIAFLDVLRSNK